MRLVDADEYEKKMSEYYPKFWKAVLADQPTIDAVPVIRCKDCKWFGKMGCAIEVVDETDMPKENDFCSFAERKDDE